MGKGGERVRGSCGCAPFTGERWLGFDVAERIVLSKRVLVVSYKPKSSIMSYSDVGKSMS